MKTTVLCGHAIMTFCTSSSSSKTGLPGSRELRDVTDRDDRRGSYNYEGTATPRSHYPAVRISGEGCAAIAYENKEDRHTVTSKYRIHTGAQPFERDI